MNNCCIIGTRDRGDLDLENEDTGYMMPNGFVITGKDGYPLLVTLHPDGTLGNDYYQFVCTNWPDLIDEDGFFKDGVLLFVSTTPAAQNVVEEIKRLSAYTMATNGKPNKFIDFELPILQTVVLKLFNTYIHDCKWWEEFDKEALGWSKCSNEGLGDLSNTGENDKGEKKE